MAVEQGTSYTEIAMPGVAVLFEPVEPPGRAIAHRWRPAVERDSVYRRCLAAADALAALIAVFASIVASLSSHVSPLVLSTAPLVVLMSKVLGNYDREDLLVRKSSLDEVPQLFQLATLYALTAWILDRLFISPDGDVHALVALWLTLMVLLIVLRTAARALSRWLTPPERCLVIGDDGTCDSMREKFARCPALHAVVVGQMTPREIVTDEGTTMLSAFQDAITWPGWGPRLDRVVLTSGSADDEGVSGLVREATTLGLKVSLLPKVLEAVGTSAQFDELEGMPLLSIRPLSLSTSSRAIKRTLDLTVAGATLLLLAPLLLFTALAVKLDSSGGMFFRQRRIGRDGRPFDMLKFRTMVADAEDRKRGLHDLNEAVGLFKIANDPRITRVGRLLRRMSLDELPQLLNVIRGEMSLVGPRPLVAEEDSRIEGWHRRRLQLTPGMTGHWQVLGSARIPLAEMVQIDYLYVTNWSLWLDLKILLRTIPYVLARRGL